MLPDSSLPGYKERRKGFVKVAVELGQTVTVELPVDGRSLQHYDPQFEAWCVEPGAFEVLVGTSSADVSLRTTFTARGPNPYAYGPRTTVAKLFADPRAREVLARHLPA